MSEILSPKAPANTLPESADQIFDSLFLARLRAGVAAACSWLIDVSLVTTEQPGEECDAGGIVYADWRGAVRGEYSASKRQWGFFCPYWHTAQALKALLQATPYCPELECGINAMAGFLMRNRITAPADPDFGLPLAFEDAPHSVNTSAILESLDALFLLADKTGETRYEQAALDALHWIGQKAYCEGRGLFRNSYDPVLRRFVIVQGYQRIPPERHPRPLLDDAVFLKGYQRSGQESFRKIFYETAETLLATEEPSGNWISYPPCDREAGRIHPRHAYWWGMPMLDAWLASGDERYRDCALRSAHWYSKALRRDGGFLRGTYVDFDTDSFGHATSGSACAAIFLLRVAQACREPGYLLQIRRALEYCLDLQFTAPNDGNLRGAILEKVLPPDGTDRSPYYLRDLGTIFFIQAATLCLKLCGEESNSSPSTPPPSSLS